MSSINCVGSLDRLTDLNHNGIDCAIDIGGSLCKAVYEDKNSRGCLQLITFAKSEVEEGLTHVAGHMLKHPDAACDVIHCTGVAVCGQVKQSIERILKARVIVHAEFSSCAGGCEYLVATLPSNQCFHTMSPQEVEECRLYGQQFAALGRAVYMTNGNRSGKPHANTHAVANVIGRADRPVREELCDLYPYIIINAGTGGFYAMIKQDGTHMLGGTPRSGKFFQGLSRLLLGTDDYTEIMALAEQGDDAQLSNYMRELKRGDIGEIYAAFPDDLLVYCFGKVVDEKKTLGDYRREDIARNLVSMIASDLAQIVYLAAVGNHCKHVIMTGGLFTHPLMRMYAYKRLVGATMRNGTDIGIHFMKHGVHVNAIGALIKHRD